MRKPALPPIRLLALAASLGVLGAAGLASQPAGPYHVREGMVHAINPPITALWDIQVEVMDDAGNFDPALIEEATWEAIGRHARDLEAAADAMAGAERYLAADPMGTLGEAPEGTDLVAIQQRLDANGNAYRAMAMGMASHVRQLRAAAQARDAQALTRLVNDTQPLCKACHDVFWYPEEY